MRIFEVTGKLLCGFVATAIIPLILIHWARCTSNIIKLPIPDSLLFGYVPLITGMIFLCSGILNLIRSESELLNDVLSLKKFVKSCNYSITKYPICSGAAMICFGLSAISRSASGFWLVSPVFALVLIAIAAGLKNKKTLSVFGSQDYKPFLSLPSASNILPSFGDRISSCLLVFVPWLIIYETFIFIGAPEGAISTNLAIEEHLPIWEFSEVFYSFAFLFSLSVPFVIKTREQLRSFVTDIWFTAVFVGIIYMVFPLVVKQRSFIPHSLLGRLILFERSIDGESGALPSCHVIWAFLAAAYFSRSFVGFKWLWYTLAVLISASCITTGAHSILDVIAGYCTFIIVIYRQKIRNFILKKAEHLSNSRWAKIIYAGSAGFVGALLAGFFLDWQSFDFFILTGSLAMAAPWIKAIGRMRCIGQDRYPAMTSAVLYSSGNDIITGLILISLLNIGMSSSFILGIYLILNGTARFVQESFRGKVQTQLRGWLKIYQGISILYILSGIIFTAIPDSSVLAFRPNFLALVFAIVVGILVTIVSGIDIPEPNQHFTH